MLPLKQLYLFLSSSIILACNNPTEYSYAIKEFREELQPRLQRIVAKGIVMGDDSDLQKATDDELVRLGKSEHAILRAEAVRQMLRRDSSNHFDIVISHLDDTSFIIVDMGEFGLSSSTVSDYILRAAAWRTEEAKNKTVDRVLSRHNYLRSAYTVLQYFEPHEKNYLSVREMASRPRQLDPYDGYELKFGDIEYALYGLARFRKKQDVMLIKHKMLTHAWELSTVSFRLMKEFPDTAYLDVLQKYHHVKFYEFSGHRPDGFTGMPADKAAPEDFIHALVAQQNERSAQLIDTMLTWLPRYTCMPDQENIINELITAVWERPCPAYAQLY